LHCAPFLKPFRMKKILYLPFVILLASCSSSSGLRLSVPDRFKEQAVEMEAKGVHRKYISLGNYKTSKVKRRLNTRTEQNWNDLFLLENIFLREVGVQKEATAVKNKNRMQFSISDGGGTAMVQARETELSGSVGFRSLNNTGLLSQYKREQEYEYIFAASIITSDTGKQKSWDMVMSNYYSRSKSPSKGIFAMRPAEDDGFATNGTDTIAIKTIMMDKIKGTNGKEGKLLFNLNLPAGYELRMEGGLIAVIDIFDKKVWAYKELDNETRLLVAAISTAILARRLKQ
jgi:hypothetical protein